MTDEQAFFLAMVIGFCTLVGSCAYVQGECIKKGGTSAIGSCKDIPAHK